MNYFIRYFTKCFLMALLASVFFCFQWGWANFSLAENSFDKKIYNFAIVNYLKSINNEETSARKREKSYYRLIESYYLIGKYIESQNMIRNYRKQYPNGGWQLMVDYYEGANFFKQKKWDLAKKSLSNSTLKYKNNPEVARFYFLLSNLYQERGQSDLAINTLKQVNKKYEADLNYSLAKLYYELDLELEGNKLQNKVSSRSLDKINQVDTKELFFFTELEVKSLKLEILLESKRYQALEVFIGEEVNKITDQKYRDKFNFYKVQVVYLQKDYTRVLPLYKNFIAKYPQSDYFYDANFYLALTYRDTKQPILALEQLNKMSALSGYAKQNDSFKTKVDKLNYYIYKELGNGLKADEYLDRLLVSRTEVVFAVEERLLKNSKEGLALNKNLLKTYQANQKDKVKQIKVFKQLMIDYYKNNQIETSGYLMNDLYSISQDPKDYYILGDIYLSLNDYIRAKEVFEKAEQALVVQKKDRTYVSDALGFIEFKLGNYSLAREYYIKNKLAEDLTYRENSGFYLGEIAKAEEKYLLADSLYKDYLKKYPNGRWVNEVLFYLGSINYYHFKREKIAIDYFNRVLKRMDTVKEKNKVYLTIAQIQVESGDTKQALTTFSKVSNEDTATYFESLLSVAKLYYNQKKYKEALSQYLEILNSVGTSLSPSGGVIAKSYYEIFVIKLKQKSAREGNYYLLKLKENYPESDLILEADLALGDYYFSNKKYKRAVGLYQSFIKKSDQSNLMNYARFYEGASYQELKQDEDAYNTFLKLINESIRSEKKDEFYYDALFELGNYSYTRGDYVKAKTYFKEIVNDAGLVSLRKDAKKNLDIIERVRNPTPYKNAHTPKKINQVINATAVKSLKEKGYLKLMNYYYKKKNYTLVIKQAKRIKSSSSLYESSVILVVKSYFVEKKYQKLYEYGLERYFDKSFKPNTSDLEYFFYALSYAAEVLKYDDDGAIFYTELKKKYPNSKYLNKLEKR